MSQFKTSLTPRNQDLGNGALGPNLSRECFDGRVDRFGRHERNLVDFLELKTRFLPFEQKHVPKAVYACASAQIHLAIRDLFTIK